MIPLLDNIIWHALTTTQSSFAAGSGAVRRYARGFSPIVGFADPAQPALDALTPLCDPGEHLYCAGWSGAAPSDWNIEAQASMFQMLWEAEIPASDAAVDALALGPEHAAQAFELASLTRPGPFGLRTIEMGEYFGCFDGERLVAMAGERMHAGSLREISGVCTHPDFQGQGFARRLMLKLVRRQMLRGETPFLHVMCDNTGAHGLYQRMGFRDRGDMVVRVIAPR